MMFEYTVKYWPEEDEVIQPIIERGIVTGKDYGTAANRIVEYYGIKGLIELTLCETYDILSEEEIKSSFCSKEDE